MSAPCKGCGKPILWGLTADGKRIPLDPGAPVYRIEATGGKEAVVALIPRPDRELAGGAAVSHFATCPKAGEFGSGRREP